MRRKLQSLLFAVLIPLLMFVILFVIARPVHAATYQVGTAPCSSSSIQDCIDFAAAGDTILIPSGSYNESLSLTKPVTLTGASSSTVFINPPALQRGLLISGSAILSDTIIQQITFQNADIYNGGSCATFPSECGGAIGIFGAAYPTIQDVVMRGNRAYQGGGLYFESGSSVVIDGAQISENVALFTGGGIDGSGNASLTTAEEMIVYNSRIFDNHASASGAGISWGAQPANSYTFVMSNTIVSSNVMTCFINSNCDGGGLDLFDLVSITIVDSTIHQNSCLNNGTGRCSGAGIAIGRAFKMPAVSLRNTDVLSNTAGGDGGGLSVFINNAASSFTLDGGSISGNTANGGAGGGMEASANLTISGTQFISNTARSNGGAISLNLSAGLDINDAHFERNVATLFEGGAIAISSTVTAQMTGTTYISNTAGRNGGAIGFSSIFLSGSVIATSTTFQANQSISGSGGGIWLPSNLTLTGTNFISNTAFADGGAIFINTNGTVHQINGGRFERNVARAQSAAFLRGGGGLYINSGQLNIDGTQFLTNTAPLNAGNGGGVLIGSADLALVNALFQNNSAVNGGGAIYATPFSDPAIVMSNSDFVQNDAGGSGGAVQADFWRSTGGAFVQNTAASSGGGLATGAATFITSTQFLSNTAANSGGGIYTTAPITMTAALLQGNRSTAGNGGGMSFSGGFDDSIISNTQVIDNSSFGTGGGIQHTGNLHLFNSTFSNNSGSAGGGLYTSSSIFMTSTNVLSNTASGDGGGFYINSNLQATDARFDGNSSGDQGGGVYVNSIVTQLHNTQIINNDAQDDGGGLYVGFRADNIVGSVFRSNQALDVGGGMFMGRQWTYITDTLFINNSADIGGGLAISQPFSGSTGHTIVNTVFARNVATNDGAALYNRSVRPVDITHITIADDVINAQEAIVVFSATVNVRNSIISSHTVGIDHRTGTAATDSVLFFANSSNTLGTVSQTDSLSSDPLFVDGLNDDFRLVTGSPAINSAADYSIATDILGVVRPAGMADRGAYEGEFTPTAITLNQINAGTQTQNAHRVLILAFVLVLLLLTAAALSPYRPKSPN